MKKHYLLTVLLASFLLFISFQGVSAQSSISGDEVCGASTSTKCGLDDVRTIVKGLAVTLVEVGAAVLFFFVLYRLLVAEVAARQGNPGARQAALKSIWNGLVGVVIMMGVFGGLYMAALKIFGADPKVTNFLNLISQGFVETAYAADERLLPNPIAATNLFDLILAVVNLAIRFFIYPAIIALWVWSGFQFVFSQGNPEGLNKAKSWLLWSFLITVAAFTLQGFILALKNTMKKIAPESPALVEPAGSTGVDGRGSPTPGAAGSQCEISPGVYGIRSTDGACVSSGRGRSTQPVANCIGQNEGTLCTNANRLGTCTVNEDSVFGCYVLPSSCRGLSEGAKCQAGNKLGKCTVSEDGSTFQCFAIPGQ